MIPEKSKEHNERYFIAKTKSGQLCVMKEIINGCEYNFSLFIEHKERHMGAINSRGNSHCQSLNNNMAEHVQY